MIRPNVDPLQASKSSYIYRTALYDTHCVRSSVGLLAASYVHIYISTGRRKEGGIAQSFFPVFPGPRRLAIYLQAKKGGPASMKVSDLLRLTPWVERPSAAAVTSRRRVVIVQTHDGHEILKYGPAVPLDGESGGRGGVTPP